MQVYASAIHELEVAIQNTPWSLTDNFVSAMRDGRGALALTGAGDPTSRGEGFSYFKEEKNRASLHYKFHQSMQSDVAFTSSDSNIVFNIIWKMVFKGIWKINTGISVMSLQLSNCSSASICI